MDWIGGIHRNWFRISVIRETRLRINQSRRQWLSNHNGRFPNSRSRLDAPNRCRFEVSSTFARARSLPLNRRFLFFAQSPIDPGPRIPFFGRQNPDEWGSRRVKAINMDCRGKRWSKDRPSSYIILKLFFFKQRQTHIARCTIFLTEIFNTSN